MTDPVLSEDTTPRNCIVTKENKDEEPSLPPRNYKNVEIQEDGDVGEIGYL